MTDLRDVWLPHEDPTGYRVEFVYGGDAQVTALRLVRKADETVVGNFADVAELLATAEADRS